MACLTFLERARMQRDSAVLRGVDSTGDRVAERKHVFERHKPVSPVPLIDFMASGSVVEVDIVRRETIAEILAFFGKLTPHEQIFFRLRAIHGVDSPYVNTFLESGIDEKKAPPFKKNLDIDTKRIEEIRRELEVILNS